MKRSIRSTTRRSRSCRRRRPNSTASCPRTRSTTRAVLPFSSLALRPRSRASELRGGVRGRAARVAVPRRVRHGHLVFSSPPLSSWKVRRHLIAVVVAPQGLVVAVVARHAVACIHIVT